jgi:hypothetical protein
MFKQFWQRVYVWAKAFDGMDDPKAEYMLGLEARLRRVEQDVAQLQTWKMK